MQLSPEQQKAIEEQKSNCPFCKIIKGEIPSKKVYEDDTILVILDINPANKGHMLIMPKEHYPIMPLIPKDTFTKLFSITRKMCGLCETALVSHGSTVFIANGGAAGQQSQHFMLHVIPRDKGDGLSNFDTAQNELPEENYKKAEEAMKNNLSIMAAKQFGRQQIADQVQQQPGTPREYSEEQIIGIIEANPPLLDAVLKQPKEFIAMAGTHPQLGPMFQGKNVEEIVKRLLEKHNVQMPGAPSVPIPMPVEPKEPEKEELHEEADKISGNVEADAREELHEEVEEKEEEQEEEQEDEQIKEESKPNDEVDLDDISNLFG